MLEVIAVILLVGFFGGFGIMSLPERNAKALKDLQAIDRETEQERRWNKEYEIENRKDDFREWYMSVLMHDDHYKRIIDSGEVEAQAPKSREFLSFRGFNENELKEIEWDFKNKGKIFRDVTQKDDCGYYIDHPLKIN